MQKYSASSLTPAGARTMADGYWIDLPGLGTVSPASRKACMKASGLRKAEMKGAKTKRSSKVASRSYAGI